MFLLFMGLFAVGEPAVNLPGVFSASRSRGFPRVHHVTYGSSIFGCCQAAQWQDGNEGGGGLEGWKKSGDHHLGCMKPV